MTGVQTCALPILIALVRSRGAWNRDACGWPRSAPNMPRWRRCSANARVGCGRRPKRATGISRPTIQRGLRELEADTSVPPGRSRRPGGGRKSATALDATLLRDHVCHFPPGTSKWNKIEHRLCSHIAMHWRGTPLVSLAAIVSLIASTHSRSGLRVRSEIDRRRYAAGVAVTAAQMATVHLTRHDFHGDWNYTIHPAPTRRRR